LVVTASVRVVTLRMVGDVTYAMGILSGKKDLGGRTKVSVSRLLIRSASGEWT